MNQQILFYGGKLVADMSREELIAALNHLAMLLERQALDNRKVMDLLA